MTHSLNSERLELIPLTLDDAPFILRLVNEPSWIEHIGDKGVRNLEDAQQYLINGPLKSYKELGTGLLLVIRKEDNSKMGLCGLLKRETLNHPDIGYAFLPEFTGKGYAIEAAKATLDFAKNVMQFKQILAITSPGNERSIHLLEKLGMHFEKMTEATKSSPVCKLFSISIAANG